MEKKDTVVMSFDVSSSVIGWAVFKLDIKQNIKIVNSGWFKPSKKSHVFDNLLKVRKEINKLLHKYKPTEVAIEDIAQFMPKVSSANTIITLALYNRTVGMAAFEYLGKPPDLYSVMTIRHGIKLEKGLPKKEEIPDLVEKHLDITLPVSHKKSGAIRTELYDEADAIACGLYHCFKRTDRLQDIKNSRK